MTTLFKMDALPGSAWAKWSADGADFARKMGRSTDRDLIAIMANQYAHGDSIPPHHPAGQARARAWREGYESIPAAPS